MRLIIGLTVALALSACSDDPELNAAYTAAFINAAASGYGQPLPSVTITKAGVPGGTTCLVTGTPQVQQLSC